LAAANKIDNPNNISVGQVITLADGTKYTIVAGDTLADIASGKFKGKVLPKGDAAKVSTTGSYPTDAGSSVKPRPTNNVMAQQVWDSKYASGWNADGTSKQLGTGDAAKKAGEFNDFGVKPGEKNSWEDSSRPGLDPKKGKPEVYDRQKQLAALGAKMKDGVTSLGLDGVNGTDTIKAEKEFGHLIVDPKTTIVVNGTPRAVNPNDIKSIQSWIKAVKEKRKKMEEVPPVYMDIVKKQSAIKESTGFTNDELNRIVSLVHHR
jgi:hypothetical protein